MAVYQIIQERVSVDSEVEQWSSAFPDKFSAYMDKAYELGMITFNYQDISPTIFHNIVYFASEEVWQQYQTSMDEYPGHIERALYEQQNNITRIVISEKYVDYTGN